MLDWRVVLWGVFTPPTVLYLVRPRARLRRAVGLEASKSWYLLLASLSS